MGVMVNERLPKFDNPPVFETVLDLTFKPLAGWEIPYIGLFWSQIRSEFPKYTIQPPLPDEIESFGEASRQINLSFGPLNNRCWFISKSDEWLLQIQNSRFISNWRYSGTGKYPNYSGFKEHFDNQWAKFTNFLDEEHIAAPQLLQANVTYVNHIDEGILDLTKVFPAWSLSGNVKMLDKPDAVAINASFPMPDQKGRLYLKVEPVIRNSDMKQLIQMTVTGKVLIASNSNEDMSEALQLAHDWVVSGFADFTSPEMHTIWKRKQ